MIAKRAFWPTALAALWMLVPAAAFAGAPRDALVPCTTIGADSVIRYDPAYGQGCVPSNPNFVDPRAALGAPNYSGGSNGTGAVSLGSGGILEVYFERGHVANSGDTRFDLRVYEVGGYSEAYYLALRPALPTTPQDLLDLGLADANGDGFFEIGRVNWGSGEIDIDATLNRTVPELALRFDAVQIVDDPLDTTSCTSTVGADIDAVVAMDAYVGVAPLTWSHLKSLFRE